MKKYNEYYKSVVVTDLLKLNQEGLSLRAIGRKYNLSHHTVKRWLEEFKLPIIIWKSNEFIDISNKKFGFITAIRPIGKDSKNGIIWLCFCDCDVDKVNPLEIFGIDLRRKRKTHCGCNNPQKIDISGQRFGHLTAIRDSGERKNKHVIWETLCQCGNQFFVTYGDLTSGHTQSCGCQRPRGEKHYNWNGGASDLKRYLRSVIKRWKKESLKKANYKCCITGKIDSPKNRLEIHHLTHSFEFILKESLETCNLQYFPNVRDYTKDQLNLLAEIFIKKHDEYGLGAVLTQKLHKEFHSMFYEKYGHEVPASEFYYFVNLKVQEVKKQA